VAQSASKERQGEPGRERRRVKPPPRWKAEDATP